MKYRQLPATYKYDTLASALAARELEYFHYDFDRINFEKMLETLQEGPERDDILARHKSTCIQMASIDRIYDALMSQVDNIEELEAAIARKKG